MPRQRVTRSSWSSSAEYSRTTWRPLRGHVHGPHVVLCPCGDVLLVGPSGFTGLTHVPCRPLQEALRGARIAPEGLQACIQGSLPGQSLRAILASLKEPLGFAFLPPKILKTPRRGACATYLSIIPTDDGVGKEVRTRTRDTPNQEAAKIAEATRERREAKTMRVQSYGAVLYLLPSLSVTPFSVDDKAQGRPFRELHGQGSL